jgi:hypothetical protein
MFLSAGKNWHCPQWYIGNQLTLVATSIVDPIVHPMKKRGIVLSPYSRSITIRQDRQDLYHEIGTLKQDLLLSAYPQKLIDLVINSSKGNNHSRKEVKPIGSVCEGYLQEVQKHQ